MSVQDETQPMERILLQKQPLCATPMEVEEVEPNESPSSKRCSVSKAEKRLLPFVDEW